jgi:CRISPR-associated protein Cas2
MPMTVLVTRNVKDRIRGFLGSCMCEVSPGVYVAPRMSKAVRERVWAVLSDWFEDGQDTSIVMTWPDLSQPGGQAVQTLGTGGRSLHEHDGVVLARGQLSEAERRSLTGEPSTNEPASAVSVEREESAPALASPWSLPGSTAELPSKTKGV